MTYPTNSRHADLAADRDRPAFTVLRSWDGDLVEFAALDFPAINADAARTVRRIWATGSSVIPLNLAACDVLDLVTA